MNSFAYDFEKTYALSFGVGVIIKDNPTKNCGNCKFGPNHSRDFMLLILDCFPPFELSLGLWDFGFLGCVEWWISEC